MRKLAVLLPVLLAVGCGRSDEEGADSTRRDQKTASLAPSQPEPLPPLPGDAAGDDLVVKTDLGEFELVIDGELPREGGYVKALELRLAVAHRRGFKSDSKFESGILIGDVELIFKNGSIYLGKTDYGELELPAKIRIERKGVIVDGKQRGDLPRMKGQEEKPKSPESGDGEG